MHPPAINLLVDPGRPDLNAPVLRVLLPLHGPSAATGALDEGFQLVIGVPQNGWFITENPTKMDDLGGTPIFGNHHMSYVLVEFDRWTW